MIVKENVSLKELTTFGIEAKARKFIQTCNNDELFSFLKNNQSPLYILGGGSNSIFTSDFDGVVLQPLEKNIEIVNETPNSVWIKSSAGVDWDDLVKFTVERELGGLENLSLIPGNVGACPVQNIGAYGVEVKDTIVKVDGFYIENQSPFSFSNEECQFGYRDSIFKRSLKGKTVITHVTFELSKIPTLKTHYGNIEEELKNYSKITIQTVRNAVISIRERKLPSPKVFGNCGSFFKNPTIDQNLFETIQSSYANIPSYPAANQMVKIPAAWLIESCGFKGIKRGNVGVHSQQALVLINLGNAKGEEVIDLANEIIEAVRIKFSIELEKEVNIL